jgi:hypothetical protein
MKHPSIFKLTYKTKSGLFCSVLVNTNAPTETAQDGATVCKWAEERARAYCADKGAEFVALAKPAESVESLTARGMSCLVWDYTPEAETTEETTAGETEAREAFPHLSAAVATYYQDRNTDFAKKLDGLTAGALLSSWYLKEYTTPRALKAVEGMQAGELVPERIRAKMFAKFTRETNKHRAKKLEALRTVAEYCAPVAVNVAVEWKRSRVWGYNPTATATGDHIRTEGSASGCGYDKRSAAISEALNKNPETLRAIYDHAEKGNAFPYGVRTFAGLPYFEGGCGVSCFRDIFRAIGYDWKNVASGEYFEAYTARKS